MLPAASPGDAGALGREHPPTGSGRGRNLAVRRERDTPLCGPVTATGATELRPSRRPQGNDQGTEGTDDRENHG